MNLQDHQNMHDSDSSDEDSDPDITDVTDDEGNDPNEDENGQDADTDAIKDGNGEPGETKRNKIAISGEETSVALTVSGFDIEIENNGKRFEITGDNNVITVSGENMYILVIGDNNQVIYKEGTHEIRMEGQENTASSAEQDDVVSSSSGIIHIKPNTGSGGVGLVDRIRGIFGSNPPDGNSPNLNTTSLGIAPITGSGPVTRRRARVAAQMGDGDAPSKIPRTAITTGSRSTGAVNTPSQVAANTNDRRNLVEQQNKEYQDSLQADQEKERLKQEKLEAEEKLRAKQEEIKKQKAEALARLPAEPAENEEDIITLAFRFPNGQLVRRNFRITDTLLTVQDFVMSRDETPVPFEIIQYPNRTVGESGEESGLLTLGDFGLKAESLHVRQQTNPNGSAEDDNGEDNDNEDVTDIKDDDEDEDDDEDDL